MKLSHRYIYSHDVLLFTKPNQLGSSLRASRHEQMISNSVHFNPNEDGLGQKKPRNLYVVAKCSKKLVMSKILCSSYAYLRILKFV